MELETGIVSHASGSARLRLANTDILVGNNAQHVVIRLGTVGLQCFHHL